MKLLTVVLLSSLITPVSAGDVPGPDHGRADRSPAPAGELGTEAPLLEVDRFSDAAGTRFRRSADPSLPGPNAPFSLDDPRFKLPVTGPAGEKASCYDLDVRPAKPKRFYVFYDSVNNYRLGQYPVIEAVPGDPGYSDLWDIWKVHTPDTFQETNWVRDAATVEALLADRTSGFSAESTGIYLNAPVVPEGTTASLKAEGRSGGATQRYYAWCRGKRAPYLYFEGSLHLGADGTIPVADARGARWPKETGYTPLTRTPAGPRNCPIVGTGTFASP